MEILKLPTELISVRYRGKNSLVDRVYRLRELRARVETEGPYRGKLSIFAELVLQHEDRTFVVPASRAEFWLWQKGSPEGKPRWVAVRPTPEGWRETKLDDLIVRPETE